MFYSEFFIDIRLLLASVSAFVVFYWIRKKLQYFKNRNIFHIKTLKCVDVFRDFFGIWQTSHYKRLYEFTAPHKFVGIHRQFLKPALLLRDLDLIRIVCVKDFQNFSIRPKSFHAKNDLSNYFITNLDGQRWKDTRTNLSTAFTPSRLKCLLNLFEKPASELLFKFIESDKPTNIYSLICRYQVSVMTFCIFGIDADAIRDENSVFYRMTCDLPRSERSWITSALCAIAPPDVKSCIRVLNKEAEAFFKQLVRDVYCRQESDDVKTKQINFLQHFMKSLQNSDQAKSKLRL